MVHWGSRVAVTLVFALIYMAFLVESGALFAEYGTGTLGLQIANLYSHNFVFFPIAGLLALIAFWRPAVLISDALGRGLVSGGRFILAGVVAVIVAGGVLMGQVFNDSNSRSLFEIAPAAITADGGQRGPDGTVERSPIREVLLKMQINASGDGGLTPYRTRCDADWLRFSVTADEDMLCFPTGTEVTVADCCAAREQFRIHLNALQAEAPSRLAGLHRHVLPVKSGFLFLLLAIGLMLVCFRKSLQALYGKAVDEVSFGVAVGGAIMLLWPLMNAAHLETILLLTGDGSSNAYSITAPLIALGFGVFAVLLVFFHLRTYPEQIEYAAKIGGAGIAAFGVFQYQEIVTYLSRTLGIGGGLVAVIVFTVAVGAIIAAIVMGVTAKTFDGVKETSPSTPSDSKDQAL